MFHNSTSNPPRNRQRHTHAGLFGQRATATRRSPHQPIRAGFWFQLPLPVFDFTLSPVAVPQNRVAVSPCPLSTHTHTGRHTISSADPCTPSSRRHTEHEGHKHTWQSFVWHGNPRLSETAPHVNFRHVASTLWGAWQRLSRSWKSLMRVLAGLLLQMKSPEEHL